MVCCLCHKVLTPFEDWCDSIKGIEGLLCKKCYKNLLTDMFLKGDEGVIDGLKVFSSGNEIISINNSVVKQITIKTTEEALRPPIEYPERTFSLENLDGKPHLTYGHVKVVAVVNEIVYLSTGPDVYDISKTRIYAVKVGEEITRVVSYSYFTMTFWAKVI